MELYYTKKTVKSIAIKIKKFKFVTFITCFLIFRQKFSFPKDFIATKATQSNKPENNPDE